MNNIFFNPFVGPNYQTNGFNGVKLLILGESHYCGDQCDACGLQSNNDCSDFTKQVINIYFEYKQGKRPHENWMRTFTKFTNVILEKKVDNDTLIDFWDSVIFYNYVQSSTKGPRIPPSHEQFEESVDGFFEVLDQYRPDLILVWGERLWDNLHNGRWGEENILDNENGRFYYYKVGNKEIPAYKVYHPSTRYFNYSYSKYLKEAIRLVSNLKLNVGGN